MLLPFYHCNEIPGNNNLKEEKLFRLMISEVSVHDQLAPLLLGRNVMVRERGGGMLLTAL